MKRLGIVVLYDNQGVMDRYVENLVFSLQNEIQEMYIIINGAMGREALEKLKCYTHKIFFRDNLGFDAGAYKDALLYFIPQEVQEEYDEIIFINDTFFGFFNPIRPLLDRFEAESVDFWGITRHPRIRCDKGEITESHIQTYFLVVRKRLFINPCFVEFWEKMPYPQTYQIAIRDFEIRFTLYFEERGFCGKSWMDLHKNLAWWKDEGNPYILHSCELIEELHVPLLKKKCLYFESAGYINALQALEYIEKEGKFDTSLIWDNIFRLCRENLFKSLLNYNKLEKFYAGHKRIYIYGVGKYGQRMKRYFKYRNWKFECFLTSENVNGTQNCRRYAEIDFALGDGIILALGKTACGEVYPMIAEKMDSSQLFLLQYAL